MLFVTYHLRSRCLFFSMANLSLAVFAVPKLSRDFTSDVLASKATKVRPILQYVPCLDGEIVVPDSAEYDVLLVRSVFDCLTWVLFVVYFPIGFLRALFPHHRPWSSSSVMCVLILVPRCLVDSRHGVPCISSLALASNLYPSGHAALALTTPNRVLIKCPSDASMDPILRISTCLLTC